MIKKAAYLVITLLITSFFFSWNLVKDKWIVEKKKGYSLYYSTPDKENIVEYNAYFENGKLIVEDFFNSSFKLDYGVYIHPSRASLESAWQKDWNMPDFKSQCWMVASGVYNKLDIISPKLWDSLACEHSYSDSIKTFRLITHELVHVYHGQANKSPDFNDISGVDWFIEGLAVYASGQCDEERIADVKKALSENKFPQSLNEFWSGNLKYGLSGTLVMFIDEKYGRQKLISLLKYNDIADIVSTLNTNEEDLIMGWKRYIEQF